MEEKRVGFKKNIYFLKLILPTFNKMGLMFFRVLVYNRKNHL